ncbi:MAG TPA: PhnD/SsuA/transferrin family substrate-binding protein, partial [Candidatus Cloacimonadota bacterium]|nr:PhnD/SsuA/transferrin family substrate-binding protein [Candidatus Cloacimonadota bacterium]
VYDGKADVACTFWSPADADGSIRDARRSLLETYPDIVEKTKIVGYTDWIPNDTVTFRKEFPTEMREKIVNSLLEFANSAAGHKTLMSLLDIDNFVRAKDADYDIVRETIKLLDLDASTMID